MGITYVGIKHKSDDAKLNTTLYDYKNKINELIDYSLDINKVFKFGNITAPRTPPADMIHLWSEDRDGTAGDATLYYRMEGGLARPWGETYNVVDYGATGAGAGTDDYAAIAACIAAAPAGSSVYFPKPTSYYKLTDELAINKALRLFGDTMGSSIVQSSNSKGIFIVTVSDVVVDRLKLTGTHVAYAARDTGERAINIQGANNGAKISDIHIRNCKIVDFGDIGIYSKYVTDFSYVNNIVDNCYYAGITGASVLRGEIRDNKISNIEADNSESTLAYGIILASEGASDDRPTDVNISRNKVINIHTWEGIDTHAGVRVNYTENEVYGCRTGIMMGSDGNYGHSPIDCNVLGNIVDSGVTDGTIAAGITFHGKEETIVGNTNGNTTIDSLADTDGVHAGMWIEGTDIPASTTVVSVDSSTQITISQNATGTTADVSFHMFSLATGVISNNIIRGCGKEDSTSTGGMVIFCTKGLDISNNSLIECAPYSINITNDNYGFTCDGNTIVDNWSNTSNDSNIYCRQDNNTGHIGGNSFSKDSKSATYKSIIGIEVSNNSGNAITLGTNYSEATTYLVDAGAKAISYFMTKVFIGDTENANMTKGLTINQGVADDEILALKSSDVAHGVTDRAETDTYGMFKKSGSGTGGLTFWGLGEDVYGIQCVALATVDNTDKDATALAPYVVYATKKSGTDIGAMGGDANLFVVQNNGSTRFIVDEDGDILYDGTSNPYQDHDDIEMLAELEVNLDKSKKLKSKEKYNKKDLEDAKLLRPFLSTKRLNMLLMGSIRQLSERVKTLETQLGT